MLRRPIARVRERMVLDQVHPLLEVDEHVAVWAHVHGLDGGQPGLLSLTSGRCLVHWSARDDAVTTLRWDEVTAWALAPRQNGATVLTLAAGNRHIDVQLPLTSRVRARTAAEVVDHVARHVPAGATADGDAGSQGLGVEPRGLRGHARRVLVTFVGMVVLLISALFASPFVPGPGALTFLAGLAILAKEYDWARDLYHGVKRQFERLWAWLRMRRERRRTRPAGGVADTAASPVAPPGPRSRRIADVTDLSEVRDAKEAVDGLGFAADTDIADTPRAQSE